MNQRLGATAMQPLRMQASMPTMGIELHQTDSVPLLNHSNSRNFKPSDLIAEMARYIRGCALPEIGVDLSRSLDTAQLFSRPRYVPFQL